MKRRCTDCHCEIPPGEVIIRTVMFEALAFHRECWALRLVPDQRPPADDSVPENWPPDVSPAEPGPSSPGTA